MKAHLLTALAATGALVLGANPAAASPQAHEPVVPIDSVASPQQLPKPTLTASGPQLLLSDSPELLYPTTPLPGALYRDRLSGFVRVLGHQQNNLAEPIGIGLAVTNTGNAPVILLGRGEGHGTQYYPDQAGQESLSRFVASHDDVTVLGTLAPGETWWSVRDLPATLTDASIWEVGAVTQHRGTATPRLLSALHADQDADRARAGGALPDGFQFAPLTFTTLAYQGTRPADPLALPVLASDGHDRGTFPHADRNGAFTVSTGDVARRLSVDAAPPGRPWSDPMPGEYEPGYDATTGETGLYNGGNYGVLYTFDITVRNANPGRSASMALLMNPAGGAGHFLNVLAGEQLLSPYVDYQHAWWYGDVAVRGSEKRVTLTTSLTGGSAGPQVLVFAPGYRGPAS